MKEKQLEMDEIQSKARLLTSESSIPGISYIVKSQKALETDWEKLNQAVLTLKEWNECAELLLEGKISLFFVELKEFEIYFEVHCIQNTNFMIVIFEGKINLDKWLTQKERMISAIGTVNVDAKVIDNQLIQIEVFLSFFLVYLFVSLLLNIINVIGLQLLRSELKDQSAAQNKVNELAHNLVAKSATPGSTQQIVVEVSEHFF